MADEFKYVAFISYSHLDKKWGDWLHRALESYRVPRRLVGTAGRDGPVPRRLFPVFRDREELPTAADLGEQINDALANSACLIVVCSPNSAKSIWVNQEILTFKRMGRDNRILAIIVDGEPNASDKTGLAAAECFPPALRFQLMDDGELGTLRTEPLAADARPDADGRNNAKLKLVAGLLGVNYDALKRRDERRQAIRRLALATVAAAVLGAAAQYAWQRYDQGYVVAESSPANSTIAVDGIELGSRIRNLPLRTGRHELRAWAPDHFEKRRTIGVMRGQSAAAWFWLEPAFEAEPYKSPSIQGGLVLIANGDDTIIAHNELTQLIFLSAKTGKILSAIDTPNGNVRTFGEFDLGGDVGPGDPVRFRRRAWRFRVAQRACRVAGQRVMALARPAA
jgi:MTH538 TIR-like domain (DUF1863)